MTDPVHLVIPVRNRRETTLRCLEHLQITGTMAWARIIVVDDGSTDGTAEAVRRVFPTVTLLPGDGELYWTGATVLGMRHAIAENTACCVWLNDDSHPVPGAVERVVRGALEKQGIVAGQGQFVGAGRADNPLVFHLLRREKWGLHPFPNPSSDPAALIPVDACRGNLVAVPRAVIDAIGYPDAANLPQYFGDTDYTLRATRAGVPCLIDPLAVIEEQERSGDWDDPWLTTQRSHRQLWKRFAVKQAGLYWRACWVYNRRHWGGWRGSILFALPYVKLALISLVRLILPPAWIGRLRRRKPVDSPPVKRY